MQVCVLSWLAVSNWQKLQYFQNKRALQPLAVTTSVVFIDNDSFQNKMHSSLFSFPISFILKSKQNHETFFFWFIISQYKFLITLWVVWVGTICTQGTRWHRRLYVYFHARRSVLSRVLFGVLSKVPFIVSLWFSKSISFSILFWCSFLGSFKCSHYGSLLGSL